MSIMIVLFPLMVKRTKIDNLNYESADVALVFNMFDVFLEMCGFCITQ